MPALQVLGIYQENALTPWGETVLGLRAAPSPVPSARWELTNDMLRMPYPVDWKLPWELETFLSPCAPLLYRLDGSSLRHVIQRGDPVKLLEILQKGLGAAPPAELRARLLGMPTLQATAGVVLEFSDPTELRQLRRSEPLRSHFEKILSPRHILVEEKDAPRLLTLLERRGIYAFSPLPVTGRGVGGEGDEPRVGVRTHFSRAPLLEPLGESLPLLEFLRQSIQQQLAFDMRYNAPDAQRPETPWIEPVEIHRITPMLIEERGGYTYVIAYSHTRKGQRTYHPPAGAAKGSVSAIYCEKVAPGFYWLFKPSHTSPTASS